MRTLFRIGIVLAACCFQIFGGQYTKCPADREAIEWCDLWISHANETNLPRVLLIGDSISRGYYPEVEKKLSDKAYVSRLSTSAFISDPILLDEIRMVLNQYHFDIIHFNNGMHGWQHSEKEYAEALPVLLTTIQKGAPHAKLIWANTTPLRDGAGTGLPSNSAPTDTRINQRNAAAAKFMAQHHIPIDDLNGPMRGHPEFHSDNVHFNDQGIAIQSDFVSEKIRELLIE